MRDIAPKMDLLVRRVAHIETSHFRSSNRIFDYHDQKYGFGGGLQLVTVYGEESRAPLILAGRVNYRVADYAYTPIEVFIRLEGKIFFFLKIQIKSQVQNQNWIGIHIEMHLIRSRRCLRAHVPQTGPQGLQNGHPEDSPADRFEDQPPSTTAHQNGNRPPLPGLQLVLPPCRYGRDHGYVVQ